MRQNTAHSPTTNFDFASMNAKFDKAALDAAKLNGTVASDVNTNANAAPQANGTNAPVVSPHPRLQRGQQQWQRHQPHTIRTNL
ncbi:hypothetical protein C0992_008868 [Termitomyces sp. T32_za158]|nr:hypothetical protein C0992_008868 [Termitomyces sp. T32_za158]